MLCAWAHIVSEDHEGADPSPWVKAPRFKSPYDERRLKKAWSKKAVLPKSMSVMALSPSKRRICDLSPKDLLSALVLKPCGANRLEFCAEFTKPAAIQNLHAGTPKNPRSPPAYRLPA